MFIYFSKAIGACIMSDMKRLFYVWFLGAKECRGLRGDEFVRPIVRYVPSFSSPFIFQFQTRVHVISPPFYYFLFFNCAS